MQTTTMTMDDSHDDLAPLWRRGLLLLALGLGGLLAWGGFAPMDQAVHGSGTLGVAGQRKAVQHVAGGTVAALAVAEGDRVRQGQVLVTLDMTPQRGELASLQQQWLAQAAAGERLRALLEGRRTLAYGAALLAQAQHVDGGERTLAVQRSLFGSQQQGLVQEQQELDARRAQLGTEIEGRSEQIQRAAADRQVVQEQLQTLETLARDGYYPKVRLLDVQRQALASSQEESRGRTELQRTREALVEATSTQRRRAAEARRDWEAELLESQRQQQALGGRIAALQHQLAQSQITAPVAGKVVALAAHTVGGVVQAGQTLMEIVPEDDSLVVQARFALGAAEKLQPGQRADLRFTSMDQSRTPVLRGEVLTVSADRLEDKRSGEPYLLVQVAVPAAERQRLDQRGAMLRPGLPVDVFVALGERPLLALLAKPLTDRLARAFID